MINKAYNIDCMEYLKACTDKQFNLAIVDPPYGVKDMTGKEFSHGRGKLRNRIFQIDCERIDKWDVAPPQEYFDELFRISEHQIIWGGNYFNLSPYRCVVVWDKVQPFKNFSAVEIAWTNFNEPAKLFKFDNRYSGKIHPMQKPVELYKWLLMNFAKAGDSVLDTHLGSGSSRIAAYDMGFDFIGTEIDREYFEEQEKRFKDHCAQGCLFTFSGGEVLS